jgi:hypothetical protein
MYEIQPYSYARAKDLDVKIYPSTYPNKKIDVYKNGDKIASIGAIGYGDYPTYLITHGKAFADNRKRLYHIRHKNDNQITGFLSREILW